MRTAYLVLVAAILLGCGGSGDTVDSAAVVIDAADVDAFTYFRECSDTNLCPTGFDCEDFAESPGETVCAKRCGVGGACETPPGSALCECNTLELTDGSSDDFCICNPAP